jgi:phospholipase A-2-activating protein
MQTLQKLVHPCQSVWCCAWMPNGDIVSAGSDNAIRIWTISEEKKAEDQVLQVSG